MGADPLNQNVQWSLPDFINDSLFLAMVDVLVGDVPNDVSVVMDEMVVMMVVVVVDVMVNIVVDVVMVISDPAGLALDTEG